MTDSIKLSERAVLVKLSIGTWNGKAVDRDVTEDTNERYDAESDAGSYSKQLVARKFLQAVSSSTSTGRNRFKLLTLPWSDSDRILSTQGHPHFTEQMRDSRQAVEAARDEFVQIYKSGEVKKEAKLRLKKMFNDDDYPPVKDVFDKFYFDVEIKPVPEIRDFRAKLSDATVKAVIKDIERRQKERLEEAMNDVFKRVAKHVRNLSERLREYQPGTGRVAKGEKKVAPKNQFHASAIFNVMEVANLLPTLNITGDKRLEKLHQDLLKELTTEPAEILRIDEKVRKDVMAKADKMLKKVESYIA